MEYCLSPRGVTIDSAPNRRNTSWPSRNRRSSDLLDYHQVTDEAQYVDYDALSLSATLMHDAALELGNLNHRPPLDEPRQDPKAPCRQ